MYGRRKTSWSEVSVEPIALDVTKRTRRREMAEGDGRDGGGWAVVEMGRGADRKERLRWMGIGKIDGRGEREGSDSCKREAGRASALRLAPGEERNAP